MLAVACARELLHQHVRVMLHASGIVLGALLWLEFVPRIVFCEPMFLGPEELHRVKFRARKRGPGGATNAGEGGHEGVPSPGSWESWHRSKPACSMSDTLSGGAMHATEHGDFVYEPAACYLRRHTADEAREYVQLPRGAVVCKCRRSPVHCLI